MADIIKLEETQKKFELACNDASGLLLMQNAGAAFKAVTVVQNLRSILSDEIIKKVFIPLMNTKIGFLTDKDPNKKNKRGESPTPYSIDVVRDCVIDAASMGLLPTFNQFNIIAGKMYPTKEGYSSLLKKLGVKSILEIGKDNSAANAPFAEITVKISYRHKDEKESYIVTFQIKKDMYSSYDQIRGKAERKAKKHLYEYLTGIDLGDADPDDQEGTVRTVDTTATVIQDEPNESKGGQETFKL